MPYPTQIFQNEIRDRLSEIFSEIPVVSEWRSIANIRGLYSPRIDVAVGPFSIERGENKIQEYDDLIDQSYDLIQLLLELHQENVIQRRVIDHVRDEELSFLSVEETKYFNRNARCLMAIEVEYNVTRKHLLGGAVNACALGRLAIVVGWTEEKIKALIKLQAYWDFLASVDKNTFRTHNLIILSPDQLRAALGLAQ